MNDLAQQISDLSNRISALESSSGMTRNTETALAERLFPHGFIFTSAVIDFPSIGSQSASFQTVAVPGANDGDFVIVGAPENVNTFDLATITGYVSSSSVVTIKFANHDPGGPINPVSAKYSILVIHQ
mgnify:CR=1 FL=1